MEAVPLCCSRANGVCMKSVLFSNSMRIASLVCDDAICHASGQWTMLVQNPVYIFQFHHWNHDAFAV